MCIKKVGKGGIRAAPFRATEPLPCMQADAGARSSWLRLMSRRTRLIFCMELLDYEIIFLIRSKEWKANFNIQ